MAELEYAYGLEPYPERVEGSNPSLPTIYILCAHEELNLDLILRRDTLYPLSYGRIIIYFILIKPSDIILLI